MKNKRRIGKGLRSLLAAAVVAQASAEPVILYDGDLSSSPEDQGWIYRLDPPVRNQSRQVRVDGAFNLNTSRNLADRAGYFIRLPQMEAHPQAPEILDRQRGYRIGFTLRLLSERRVAPNQEAGFSWIVLSDDLLGVDLGFGASEVFARSSELERAEENRTLPFQIDKEYADFELDIQENEYRLSANGQEILVGSLRNYSDAGDPYTVPNLLFFGDNTESAGASVNLRRFWVDIEPSVPQPGEPNPLPPVEPEPPLVGDSIAFSVVEEESVLFLSGTALSIDIQAQKEGSLSASYSGTLRLLLADGRIQFQPASRIDAQPSGEWEPKSGGKSGSAPADYGGIVPGSAFIGNTFAAARNVKFTLASDWIELIERNEERIEFSASSLLFAIPASFGSVLDTATLGLFPIRLGTPIDGISGLNRPKTPASLAVHVQGNVQTLTIPVQVEVFARIISDDDLKLTFSGQIIARRNLLAKPTMPAPPRLAIQRLPTGEVQLSWNTISGDNYLVEQSANLRQWETAVPADGNNQPILIRADGETLVWTAPTDETARYYRVIHNPLPR